MVWCVGKVLSGVGVVLLLCDVWGRVVGVGGVWCIDKLVLMDNSISLCFVWYIMCRLSL